MNFSSRAAYRTNEMVPQQWRRKLTGIFLLAAAMAAGSGTAQGSMSYVVGQLSPTNTSVSGNYFIDGYNATATYTGSQSAATPFTLGFSWTVPNNMILTGASLELNVPGAANPAVTSSTSTSIGTYQVVTGGYNQLVGYQYYQCGFSTCSTPIYQWVTTYGTVNGTPGSASFAATNDVQMGSWQLGSASFGAAGTGTTILDLFAAAGPNLGGATAFAVSGVSNLNLTPTLINYGDNATINYSVSTSAAPLVSGLLTLQFEPTPEPGTVVLIGGSLAALLMMKRRRV